MTIGTGILKAGVKLADVVASATGKQLNRIGTKLGMDKDILKGMDANKIKTAIMDEGQVYIKNMRKNQNRRTGTAAIAGLAGGAAAYGVSDFIGDMLGIKKSGDATLKGNEKPFVPKSEQKSAPAKVATKTTTTKKSKPPETPKSRPKVTPKVEDTKKQLMMKEKYSGKDSEVKFNSKGGMMKKYSKGGMTKKGKK
jgi:hypothetical protein